MSNVHFKIFAVVLMSQKTHYSTALCITKETITILKINVTLEMEYPTLKKESLCKPRIMPLG